jgi:trk system potassium uptake protein TrkH
MQVKLKPNSIILMSFIGVILIGALLLSLPISSSDGKGIPFIDALFTATTSACVTGLTTVSIADTFSTFGHIVILALIQIGGLGVITVIASVAVLLNKRLGLSSRLLLQDAFNLTSLSGIVSFIKRVLIGTFVIEGIGALLYMTSLVPRFGLKGIWYSVFNSVSAFCNAGIDIMGNDSLAPFVSDPVVNLTTCFLIILGGLGFIVWWDVIRVVKNRKNTKVGLFRALTLHSKIAIVATLVLIVLGTVCFFVFEYSNPDTMGELNVAEKLLASAFQSVTTRTAGFYTVSQADLTSPSVALSLLLMMIGGSPVGTAGGIKTVTVAVLVCSAFATIRNKNSATLFGRRISEESIKKAVAVVMAFVTICATSTLLLMATNNASFIDVLYETVSATATVGLSRNLTSTLNEAGKLIIILTMYFGRVGPISLAVALGSKNESQNVISEPIEDIIVG